MTDYNNRYSSRRQDPPGRGESEFSVSRDRQDASRRYNPDSYRSSYRRTESAYEDRYSSRYDDRYESRYDGRARNRYDDRYDDRYESRYEDRQSSYRRTQREPDYNRYSRYDSYYEPPRRQEPPRPPQKKPDRSALIVLAVLAVFIIAAIILCINVLGGRRSDDAFSPPVATAAPSPTIQATAAVQLTPTPSPQPTATPTPAARMSAEYTVLDGIPTTDRELGLQACPQVPDSYFDDAVFIGDSVTLKLNYFVRDSRKEEYPTLLGAAQFLTAGSLGSGEALEPLASDSLHPSYMGQKMLLEDSVAAMGAKKVFIMLGMNDVARYGIEESAQNMMKLVKRIVDKSPDAKIFIQSATPRIQGDYNKLNNNALFEYDLKLYEYCLQLESSGVYFVDVAHALRDEKGNLPLEYCSDADGMGLHFTAKACKEWINYLYTHALV